MAQLEVDYTFSRLEIAIKIYDKDFIIECLDELIHSDGLEKGLLHYIFMAKSLTHLTYRGREKYLESFKAITNSLAIENSKKGQLVLEIVKQKIIENQRY